MIKDFTIHEIQDGENFAAVRASGTKRVLIHVPDETIVFDVKKARELAAAIELACREAENGPGKV